MAAYAKTIVAVVLGALYALQAALSDNHVTNTEWVAIAVAALTAIGVFVTPNKPTSAP
jgi:hypothetical protein